MQTWTPERVIAIAPDAAAAAAGQALASAKKWTGKGQSERAIWGLCQGSGKEPYQARVDLTEPAFKCSCPSRKFPCKHGLGLLLLFAKEPKGFVAVAEPEWVAVWIAGRADKAEKKVERAKAAVDKPVDVEAQAKRVAAREGRVSDAIAMCRVWLEDVMRRGLAKAQTEDGAAWERIATRMVDAQAPGLAGMIRRIPEVLASGSGWDVRTLDLLGRLHLLLLAGERIGDLPPDLAVDARTALGWNQSKDDVLVGTGVDDSWVTMGQVVQGEDRLRVRRTWLVGRKSLRRAMMLDFAAGSQPLEPCVPAGSEFEGEIVFYPGRAPLRGLVKSKTSERMIDVDLGPAADASIEEGLCRYAEALGANPWLTCWPLALANVRVAQDGKRWYLVDSEGYGLPLKQSFVDAMQLWRLISASSGSVLTVLAEWDGERALPIGAFDPTNRVYHDLATRWVA